MKGSLTFLVFVWLAWQFWPEAVVTHGPGVIAPTSPLQSNRGGAEWSIGAFTLQPVADFELQARVLAKRNYGDFQAALAPTDLALGWGPMSDESVLQEFTISQRRRFYYWHTETLPISMVEVIKHSANMHLIPGDDEIAEALGRVRVGDVISLRGQLVNARGERGFRWRSSMTRTDTGNGACELIYVRALRIGT